MRKPDQSTLLRLGRTKGVLNHTLCPLPISENAIKSHGCFGKREAQSSTRALGVNRSVNPLLHVDILNPPAEVRVTLKRLRKILRAGKPGNAREVPDEPDDAALASEVILTSSRKRRKDPVTHALQRILGPRIFRRTDCAVASSCHAVYVAQMRMNVRRKVARDTGEAGRSSDGVRHDQEGGGILDLHDVRDCSSSCCHASTTRAAKCSLRQPASRA